MPKDEFDFDDPLELTGVALVTHEDTTDAMCECFIEEFLWLGYNHKQILSLFRNPHYVGPNLVLEKRGEPYVKEQISQLFSRWGRTIAWSDHSTSSAERPTTVEASRVSEFPETPAGSPLSPGVGAGLDSRNPSGEGNDPVRDPLGSPIPQIEV